MKSVEKRFYEMRDKYPLYSDFIVFCEAVCGQDFCKRRLSSWFGKLVPKSDWEGCPKNSVTKHLCQQNEKHLRRVVLEGKLPVGSRLLV